MKIKTSRDTATMGVADWLRLLGYAARRRMLIGLSALLCLAMATGLAVIRRDVYQASTVIIVRPQHIPKDFIKSTVSSDLSKVIKTLSQQIMSRSRLQKIIEEFDLYPEIRETRGMLEAIETMRDAIGVESRTSDSFSITFKAHDPVVARDVANSLASLFIQEHLRVREEKARTITRYLEKELAKAQDELERIEGEIRTFQERNMGALPSQEQAIASTMAGLMSQFQTLSEQIRAAQNRKLILTGRLRDQERAAARAAKAGDSPGPLSVEAELAKAKRELAALEREFTEDHPKVKAARRLVAELEAKVAAQKARRTQSDARAAASFSLKAELASTDRELAALLEERARLRQRMNEYEGKLAQIPRVAEQFATLRRKYEFAQANYNDLRKKAEEARRSQQMEERQKGEQFEIVDKAVVPDKPKHPRKHEIIVAGLVFGLLLGFGVSLALSFFDPTFRDEGELVEAVPLPLLSSIPRLSLPRAKRG